VSSQPGAVAEIRAALAAGRHADAERTAHTLKGVAGSLGALELQRQAGELEAALRRGAAAPEVTTLLAPLENTLGDFVADLRRVLPPGDEPATLAAQGSVDPEALRSAVEKLEELLSQDAVEALDAFDESAPLLSAAYGERVARVRQLVKGYRFEEALAALREAGSSSGPRSG
jgi:two-component system sensor histidine kinase/response regulator